MRADQISKKLCIRIQLKSSCKLNHASLAVDPHLGVYVLQMNPHGVLCNLSPPSNVRNGPAVYEIFNDACLCFC